MIEAHHAGRVIIQNESHPTRSSRVCTPILADPQALLRFIPSYCSKLAAIYKSK